jgi:hypothetical protein
MAMVPAVVSGVLGYLPKILSGSSRSHKAALIRENTSRPHHMIKKPLGGGHYLPEHSG